MLSALLLTLALPPWGMVPLGFIALAPLVHSVHRLPAGPTGRRSAARAGFLFAGAFWTVNLLWVLTEVAPRYAWGYPGFGLLVLMLGGLGALFGTGLHRLAVDRRWPLFVAVPVAWVAMEWVKGHVPFGLAFPWLGLGVTLTEWPSLLAPAEWFGEAGVSFWLAAVSGGAVWSLGASKGRVKLRRWLFVAALVMIPASASLLRDRAVPLEEGPVVMVVGTDRPPRGPTWVPPQGAQVLMDALEVADREITSSVQLLVLPEGVIPVPPLDGHAQEGWEAVEAWAAARGIPVLLGAPGSGMGERGVTNSAYLLTPDGGSGQRYDKIRLVPGMEIGRYDKGAAAVPVAVGPWSLGPSLCYESLFGGLARIHRRGGADLLVNMSSDVWFGDDDSVMGSWFLSQHPAHLVLRAVETRTSVARAANGGFTGVIDPRGRWLPGRVSPGPGATQAAVPLFAGTTLFTLWGDALGPLCLALALIAGWLPLGSRGRTNGPTDAAG